MKLQKNVVYVFILVALIYFASVGVYVVNSIYMLDDKVFLLTRVLMMLCLLVVFLIGLRIKMIVKKEGSTGLKIALFGRFESFCKICTICSVGILGVLLIFDLIR